MNFCDHAIPGWTRWTFASRSSRQLLKNTAGAVKAILLNQQLIAGIGNLYTDEILFRAPMHPATEATRLSGDDLRRLFRATRYVLERAIALKTDFNRLPKSWLLTHRGKAGRCPRCGRALKSATIGGRTSWFACIARLSLRALVIDRSKDQC